MNAYFWGKSRRNKWQKQNDMCMNNDNIPYNCKKLFRNMTKKNRHERHWKVVYLILHISIKQNKNHLKCKVCLKAKMILI